jgi:hypothetical protein
VIFWIMALCSLVVEVCADMDLALEPRPDTSRGPDLVAQIMFGSAPGSGLVQMIAIRRYIKHFGLSQAIIFSKEKNIRSYALLMLVTQSGLRKQIPPT